MSFEFKIATIQHEAETYFSQGLYQEALSVYKKFIADISDLHPTLRATIAKSIRRIRSAAKTHERGETAMISDVEIKLIRKDWNDDHASGKEQVASAQALCKLGLYEYALEEFRRLLGKKVLAPTVMRGTALCLVNLVRPKYFTVAVDYFASEIFKAPRNRKALKFAIAKQINSERYPRHFSALCHHLAVLDNDLKT